MRLRASLPTPVLRALRWDATAGLLVGLFNGALGPFLAVTARRDLGASVYLIALMTSAQSVGNLFNPLVAHRIRHRPKLVHAVWPLLAGRSLYLLMPVAVAAPVYVAVCFAAGAVCALSVPAYAAVIRDAYPVSLRGRMMGLVRVLVMAGAMLGALAGGALLAGEDWRWVFPAVAVVGLVSAVAFSRVGVSAAPNEASASNQVQFWEGIRSVRADRSFALYATCFYLYGIGNLILGPVIPVFQVDELKITPRWVGYLATTTSAFSILGYLYWGRVLDRHGPFRMMLMVMAVLSVMPVTYFLAHQVPVLLIAAAAAGFAAAGGDLGYINAGLRFGSRDAAVSYAGTFAFLQACRGIPGPFIGAGLHSLVGPRPVFMIALGLWTLSVGILLSRGGLRMAQADE